jgi:tripartite-type tricarboxylate transporter receptor subunit TctC
MRLHGAIFGLLLAVATATSARTEDSAAFYKGKIIRIVISAGVAGGYMEYARTLAEFMGNHIDGRPSFIVQSMPGAGGFNATNYLFTQAPQDGTTIGMVHSTIPLAPLWGSKGVRYDTLKFNWIGAFDRAPGICIVWSTSSIMTWQDMLDRPTLVGSSGAGSQMDAYPTMLNKMFGAKLKVIGGYKDGTDIYIAMERGEVEGRCGGQLTVIKSLHPDWLTEHKIRVPIVISTKRHPEFPDTPAVSEFIKDDSTRQQLELMTVSQGLDRPVLLPPGVPPERVKEIRDAFKATVTDSAFLAEIKKKNMGLDPVYGEEMTEILAKAFASPPEIVAAARETLGGR